MSIAMNVEQQAEITIVKITGRLDGNTMKEIEEQFEAQLFTPKKLAVLFDLSGLDYISSAGLRVMLLALKKLTAYKGKLALAELQANVLEIFQLSGFSKIFPIVTTYEEGIHQLQK